jgi:hypothetical protein
MNETIIVVHGTFSAPDCDGSSLKPRANRVIKWYEPGGSFCTQLDECLTAQGKATRTWAHLPKDSDGFFWWSGANTWYARSQAAGQLANYVRALVKQGWKCHFVAHSHGGNVLLDALNQLHWSDWTKNDALGDVFLLGTPIYGEMVDRRLMILTALAIVASAGWLYGGYANFSLTHLLLRDYWVLTLILGTVASVILLVRMVLGLLKHFQEVLVGIGRLQYGFDLPLGSDTVTYAVNSTEDEAFRLLQYVLHSKSPLGSIPLSFRGVVFGTIRRALQYDRKLVGRLNWVAATASGLEGTALALAVAMPTTRPSWMGAALATFVGLLAILFSIDASMTLRGLIIPARWLILICHWFLSVIQSVASIVAYNRFWNTFRSAVLGMSGAPVPLHKLRLAHGESDLSERFVYWELPEAVVRSALERRREDQDVVIKQIRQLIDAKSLPENLLATLHEALTNVNLVHATYYVDKRVIQRIATVFNEKDNWRSLWQAALPEQHDRRDRLLSGLEEGQQGSA